MISCEHAQTALSSDAQGKAWEHFWLGDRYQFSNQIPNLRSFTRTDPGWVLSDNNYCTWQGVPPARLRETTPVVAQQLGAAGNEIAPMTADAGMASGGFGVLVLAAAAVGGVMWWRSRDKMPDPNYHPMADLPYQLPALRVTGLEGPDELEWQEGDPIPEGYELVDESNEDAAAQKEEEDEEGDSPKVTVPSPFLPEALKEQIRNEAQDAARHQAHVAVMQGMHLAERIYPRSLRTPPGASHTSVRLAPPTVEAVEPLVGQPVVGLVKPPVEPDPREVELFEELVEAFCPLALDPQDGTTQEAVREALRLGKSQNWITSTLFGVSKNTRDYDTAVSIVKAMKEAQHG